MVSTETKLVQEIDKLLAQKQSKTIYDGGGGYNNGWVDSLKYVKSEIARLQSLANKSKVVK